ncbi:zinc transporter ZIP1 isoform X2 [Syngnathoides biaculeatus]|uniref:zinc transporter ZIP1 isoform X2 n=1 Tax=Syngnathoides biaculeatus TaxID=300417 RepID=UPI002ADDD6C0|nr:zinc transporter ZIP1 isoform X2 [Syngnathoides biaculeatus]
MEYLLQVKIGALFGLLLLTLIFGFIPARVTWFRNTNGTETHRTVLSLISCFAGGVFLAACLLDIIPDYLEDMNTALDSNMMEINFPLPEFIMAVGFFTVLILERMVLNCREMRGTVNEWAPLIQDNRNGHGHGHVHGSTVLEICIAILVHKSIIVFSLSVKLVQSAVRPVWVVAYIGVFAVMSPLGIAIGISVMEAQLAAGTLIQAVLEGLAAGTFIYITFLEILPHELNSPGKQLLKVLFILLGFIVMAALTFLG